MPWIRYSNLLKKEEVITEHYARSLIHRSIPEQTSSDAESLMRELKGSPKTHAVFGGRLYWKEN